MHPGWYLGDWFLPQSRHPPPVVYPLGQVGCKEDFVAYRCVYLLIGVSLVPFAPALASRLVVVLVLTLLG